MSIEIIVWNPNDGVRAPSYMQQHVGSDFKVFRHMGVVVRRTQSTTLLIIRTRSPSDTGSFMWGLGGAGAPQNFLCPIPWYVLCLILSKERLYRHSIEIFRYRHQLEVGLTTSISQEWSMGSLPDW